MDRPDERIEISALGVEVLLRPSGADCPDGDIVFDVTGEPRGFITYPHVHADQVESFEVISGAMKLRLGGRGGTHVIREGGRATVPAGVVHRQMSAGRGRSRVRVRVSPAGPTENFLRRLGELSATGQFNRVGLPRALAGAQLIRDFGDTGRAAFPPAAVQRLMSSAILTVHAWRARRAGGRGREYRFVDQWDVAAPAHAVYEALAEGRTYPEWWRPVYISVDSDGPPAVGRVARQHFKGRLPYHLRTTSRITGLEPGSRIEVEVEGDLRGRGIWTLSPAAAGTHGCFEWNVYADRLLLRLLTPVLRPALRANHNWAIARAMDGLEPYVRSRSLTGGAPDASNGRGAVATGVAG